MKRRNLIGGGVALLGVGAGITLGLRREPPAAGEAEAALWRMSFEQPGGGNLAMAGLRGRPLLLNFWATWCAPCIKEMPLLDQFYREHAHQGWTVVGLAIDSLAPVREYLARLPIGFPVALAGANGVELLHRFGNLNGNLPFSVVFGRSGLVSETKLGSVEPSDLARWSQIPKSAD